MTIFYGHSKDSQFIPDNRRSYLDFLVQNEGKKLVVNIGLDKAKRSLDQNSYLWGVVYKVISDHTGSTENELHEIFKRMFIQPRFIKWKDTTIKVPGHTSDMNKVQFGEYIERIRAEVSSMGVTIPEPDNKNIDIQYPVENNKTSFD